MSNIREMLHEIGNWHNKISMGAGVAKEIIKEKSDADYAPEDKKDLLERIEKIEQHALEADKALNKLKDTIYEKINPDIGEVKRGSHE